jgi:hypothetical protein
LEYVSNSAVNGVHYSAPTTITIPAGEAIANLVITGDIPSYNGGRVDTVSVRVVDGGDIPAANYYKSIRLYIRPDCNEANVVLASLEGDYDNSNEDLDGSAYGPYTVTVDDITAASATTAVATISNIYDTGWTGMLFDMDWTDLSARTVITRDQEIIGSDAGDLSSTYAGFTVSIRPHPSMTDGTYSYCTQTWTLTMQLGVTGLGYFNNTYQVDLAR